MLHSGVSLPFVLPLFLEGGEGRILGEWNFGPASPTGDFIASKQTFSPMIPRCHVVMSCRHVHTVLHTTCLPKLHIFDKTSILATCFFLFELYVQGRYYYLLMQPILLYLNLMLYYCVCFEARSLVISGQLFSICPPPPTVMKHACT